MVTRVSRVWRGFGGMKIANANGVRSNKSGYFMNCCRETTKMGVPPGNRRVLVPRRT
jgi:hypothetical protein